MRNTATWKKYELEFAYKTSKKNLHPLVLSCLFINYNILAFYENDLDLFCFFSYFSVNPGLFCNAKRNEKSPGMKFCRYHNAVNALSVYFGLFELNILRHGSHWAFISL